ERFEGELDLRVLLGAVYVTFPCPCGATHESACAVLAECQHDVGGKIVGGVLLAAQNRDCEHVEHGVPYFVQDKPEELASCCIGSRNSGGVALHRQRLDDVLQQLIAEGHGFGAVLLGIPRVHDAAFHGPDDQSLRQAKRAQNSLGSFQNLPVLQRLIKLGQCLTFRR